MIELSFWIRLKHLHRVYLTDCLRKTVFVSFYFLLQKSAVQNIKFHINITLEILTCNDAGGD